MLENVSEKISVLNVRELTKYQGDAIWFLLRRFRLTASVMENILATLFKFYPEYTDSPNRHTNNIRKLFEFKRHEPVAPIPDSDEDLQRCTLEEIKSFCKARNITGYNQIAKSGANKGNYDQKLRELREWRPPDDENTHIYKTLFRAWFLQGGNTTYNMKQGLLNEIEVLRNLYK